MAEECRQLGMFLIAAIVVAGCGGGGGDSSSPVAPPPPIAKQPIQIELVNTRDTAIAAISTIEKVLQLTDLARHVVKTVNERGESQFDQTCLNGTVTDFDHTDNDQNGRPTPGDTIRVTYRQCDLKYFNGARAVGDFLVTLEAAAGIPTANDKFLSGRIDASTMSVNESSNLSFSTNGSFTFEIHEGLLSESIRATGSIDILTTDSGVTSVDEIGDFDFDKSFDFTSAKYALTASGRAIFQALGGYVDYEPATVLSGFLNTIPHQGHLEFVGANGSRVAASADSSEASTRVILSFDGTGDGAFTQLPNPTDWPDFVAGHLWWYEPGATYGYQTQLYELLDFTNASSSPSRNEIVDVNSALRVQFDRELDSTRFPQTVIVEQQSTKFPYSVDLVTPVEFHGAAVILRPTEQLAHDLRYEFPKELIDAYSLFGIRRSVRRATFLTNQSLTADIVASATIALGGDVISLDGSGSTAMDNVISAYSWTQVGGPAGLLVGASSTSATFTLPSVAAPESIQLQLEVTNSDGQFDRELVQIHAFQSVSDVRVLHIVGEPGEMITAGREYLASSADGAFTISNTDENIISAEVDVLMPDLIRLRMSIAAPDDDSLVVGAYDDATRHPFEAPGVPGLSVSGIGRGCNTSLGRFDVLDVSFDANGDLSSAAIDFEQSCTNAFNIPQEKLTGSLRIGTLIQLPSQ